MAGIRRYRLGGLTSLIRLGKIKSAAAEIDGGRDTPVAYVDRFA